MSAAVAQEIAFVAGLSVKAAAVFGVGALLVLALRRSPAALRHRAGTWILWSAAALPVAALVLPAVEVPVLPARAPSFAPALKQAARGAAPAFIAEAGDAAGAAHESARPDRAIEPTRAVRAARRESADPASALEPARAPSAAAASPGSAPAMPVVLPPSRLHVAARAAARLRRAIESLGQPLTLACLLALLAGMLWAIGALLLWARLVAGLRRVARLGRGGVRAPEEMEALLARSAAQLGIDPGLPIRLLIHPAVPVAMTAGSRAPVVLLPASSIDWSADRRRVVLLHELAHIQRGDWLQLISSEIALAVWWFHPLAWWLSRAIRRDAEQAADDLVLAAGTRPSDYAAHLLEIVRGLRDGETAPRPAMAMAQLAGIEARVRSILDGQPRRRPRIFEGRALAVGLGAAALLLAVARPTAARASDAEPARMLVLDVPAAPVVPAGPMVGMPNIGTASIGIAIDPRPVPAPQPMPAPAPAPAPRIAFADAPVRAPRAPLPPEPPEAAEAPDAPEPPEAPQAPEAPLPPLPPLSAAQRPLDEGDAAMNARRAQRDAERLQREAGRMATNAQRADAAREQAELARLQAEAAREQAEALASAGMELRQDGAGLHVNGHLDGKQLERTIEKALRQVQVKLAGVDARMRSRGHGDADDDEDYYERGLRLHHRGRFQEAIAAFQKAIELDQRPDDASYNIACGYAQLNDAEHAAEWLKKAADEGFDVEGSVSDDDDFEPVRSDPKFRAAVNELRSQRGARHAAEARALERRFERLAQRNPSSSEPFDSLGRELLDAGSYDTAFKAFTAAAQRSDNPGTPLYNAACALSLKGDKGKALDQLQKAIEGGFDDLHQLKRDDDLDAIRDEPRFQELLQLARDLELDVDRGSFELNLGSVHIWSKKSNQRRSGEDLAHYQDMAKKHADLGRAQYNLGYAQLAADDAAGAEASFAKSAAMGYRKGASLYNVACAQAREGHKDAAFASLKESTAAGYDAAGAMSGDDDLESLHGDPRYRQMKRESGKHSSDDDDDDDDDE